MAESIETAIKNNPAVMVSREAVASAKAVLDQANSKWYPNITLVGEYGSLYQGPITTTLSTFDSYGIIQEPIRVEVGIDETATATSYIFQLKQPIFTWGKISNAAKVASDAVDIADLELEEMKKEIAFDVTSAYFSILRTKKFFDLTLEAKNVLSDHYKQVEVAYNAGLLKRQDILKVELELSVIEQNSIKAEHAFELSKLTFNTILKSRQRVVYDIQDEDFKAYTSYPDMADEAVMQEANKSRIDLKKFTVAKKMALDYKSLLTGEYFPDVALLANYGWERLDYKEFDVDTRNHMIALGLSWTLFNGFETGAKIKKAEADLRQAYASENLLTKKIELEVKEAMLNLRDSVRRIDNSRKSAALADENLRIALKRYNAGVGTSADVVYAQRDLIQAKQELLEAKFDFEITKAKINKITDKDIL